MQTSKTTFGYNASGVFSHNSGTSCRVDAERRTGFGCFADDETHAGFTRKADSMKRGVEISGTDRVLASVCCYGREIASMQFTGCETPDEVLTAIARQFSNLSGLLTVKLRNPRCGWSTKHTIRTSRPTSMLPATA